MANALSLPSMDVPAQVRPPQAPNLLGMASGALELRNQANNLQAFQAKQAAGRDFQAAIGPDGQLNLAGLNQRLAQDPQAALAAPALSQQGLQMVQAHLQNQGISINNAVSRLKWISNATGPLLLPGANPTQADVRNVIVDGVKDGVLTAREAAGVLSGVPSAGPQLVQWLKGHFAAAQGSLQALEPHLVMDNTGAISFARQGSPLAPGFGQPVPGTGVQMQMSPAQAATPVTLPTPSGAGQVTTLGQFDAAANGGAAPKIVATGPSTQQQAANQVAGTAQGNQAASVVADSTNLAQTRAALQGIRVELPNANGGPLSDLFRNVGATLGEIGIPGMNQATAFDLLQKGQAQVVVSRVADGLGVPTDGKMAALSAQTPGTHMTGTAGAVAVGQIEGVLDYQYARAKAAQAAGVTANPASSSQFNLEWQGRFPNAAVFQFPYLPRAFQQEYWHSMSAREQKAFKAEYRDAAQAGFVRPDPFNSQ